MVHSLVQWNVLMYLVHSLDSEWNQVGANVSGLEAITTKYAFPLFTGFVRLSMSGSLDRACLPCHTRIWDWITFWPHTVVQKTFNIMSMEMGLLLWKSNILQLLLLLTSTFYMYYSNFWKQHTETHCLVHYIDLTIAKHINAFSTKIDVQT